MRNENKTGVLTILILRILAEGYNIFRFFFYFSSDDRVAKMKDKNQSAHMIITVTGILEFIKI